MTWSPRNRSEDDGDDDLDNDDDDDLMRKNENLLDKKECTIKTEKHEKGKSIIYIIYFFLKKKYVGIEYSLKVFSFTEIFSRQDSKA